MEILKSVKHTNIIALKEIIEDDKTLYIVTELYVSHRIDWHLLGKHGESNPSLTHAPSVSLV
jgi:hypothetical protein